jgi:hypothetical protein
MIIYNVTCNIPEEIEEEWLAWMKNEHIPEVFATGKFVQYRMFKLLTNVSDNEGVNFAIQYTCESIQEYNDYNENHGPKLKEKTYRKYGEKVLAFRTLLEEVPL